MVAVIAGNPAWPSAVSSKTGTLQALAATLATVVKLQPCAATSALPAASLAPTETVAV